MSLEGLLVKRPLTVLALLESLLIVLLKGLSIKLIQLPLSNLASLSNNPIPILGLNRSLSPLILGQLLLVNLPPLGTTLNMNGDAAGPIASATDKTENCLGHFGRIKSLAAHYKLLYLNGNLL